MVRYNLIKYCLVILSVFCSYAKGQTNTFEKDYIPFQSHGKIPADFLRDPLVHARLCASDDKILGADLSEKFYSEMDFYVSRIFQSGQIYLDNALTQYLDSVVNRLLKDEPVLQKKVHVYLTRYSTQNAVTFPDGTILVNVGLLEALNSEAELAFVLAHEVAHFSQQHSAKHYKRLNDMNEAGNTANTEKSKLFLSLRYSRESEMDADGWALTLMAQAGYDPKQAASALTALKDKSTQSVNPSVIFDSDNFKSDTSWTNKKAIYRAKLRLDGDSKKVLAADYVDDLFETHPDLDKRIEAATVMAQNLPVSKNPLPANSFYSTIRQYAAFERAENYYFDQDYLNSLRVSLYLLQKYPANVYLMNSVSRCLYWMSYYKEIGEGFMNFSIDRCENQADLSVLYAYITEMPLKDNKKLSYSWAKKINELQKDNEDAQFYNAVCISAYLGDQAARGFYREYLSRYPAGKYKSFALSKLQ